MMRTALICTSWLLGDTDDAGVEGEDVGTRLLRRRRLVAVNDERFVGAAGSPACFGRGGARRIFVSAPSSVDSEVRPGLRRPRRVNRLGRVRRTDQHATARPAPLRAGTPSTGGVAIYRVSVATIADLATKRTVDICGSLFGLVVLAPLMILVACLIRLTSRGPAIYAHTRVGQGGEEFVCYKFRTMVADAEAKKSELVHLNAHD